MNKYRKYLLTDSDDLMDFDDFVRIQNSVLIRKVKRIFFGTMLGLSVFLTGCRTVPPSAIGSETRAVLDDLAGKQTESAITTERLSASTGEVSAGLERLAEKAPENLKPEIDAISGNATESVRLAKTLEKQLAEERGVTADLKESAGKDAVETARITAEKQQAEKGELKAKNQRNIACAILGVVSIIGTFLLFMKIKRFFQF